MAPPVDRRVKKKGGGEKKKRRRKQEREKGKCFPETNSLGKNEKRKRVGNWSMPLHKLPLIMVSKVQENAVFIHEFSKISLLLRSLALAPDDKSWLHHCYWNS